MKKKNNLICLIGASGSGKDTLKVASGLPYVVSYRTRPKRVGEIEGIDGYFITEEEFLSKPDDQWIAKTHYSGNYYGITEKELETLKEEDMIYVIDWDGFEYLKEKLKDNPYINVVSVYIDAKQKHVKKRMRKQKRTKKEIERRMKKFAEDIQHKYKSDYIIENHTTIPEVLSQLKIVISLI